MRLNPSIISCIYSVICAPKRKSISFARRGLIRTEAPASAILRVNRLQKFLITRPSVDLNAQFRRDAIGDLRRHRAAKRRIEAVAALKKRFNQSQFIRGDEAEVIGRRSGVHFRIQKGPRGFHGLLVHHDRSRYKISRALILLAEKYADDTDAVEYRELIDNTQQIARNGIIGCDGSAIVFHYAELRVAFTGSLAVPNSFEDGEISGIE